MKILIAGASGAIGQPLVDLLTKDGQIIYGITHSKERAERIAKKGGTPIILNVLERDAVLSTISNIRPDIIIDMLTSLPKEYTPEAMRKSAEMDAKLRREGGGYLRDAAKMSGVKRYIVQSSGFWYAPGLGLADESDPFAFKATPGIASGSRLYAEIEKSVLQASPIEGVALRFGFFYGPGTWFHPGGNVADQIHAQQFPIIGRGQGIWNFVHIEDAAKAIASAIQCTPGLYNIVNDYPTQMSDWLPAFARYLGAPEPPHITEHEGIKVRGLDAVYYATKLRGATNAKAKRSFNFDPRPFEWLLN